MKREILYRGKDEKGNWYEGYLLEGYEGSFIVTYFQIGEYDHDHDTMGVDCVIRKVLPETVGQYWRNDDKGNKIFTGDTNSYSYYCGDEKIDCVDVVCFDVEGGYHYWRELNGERPSFIPYEVNGNIHDNPELIKNK